MRRRQVSSSPPEGCHATMVLLSMGADTWASVYFTKGRSDHHVNPIRAVNATRPDRSPRRHAARAFCCPGWWYQGRAR